MKSNDEAPRDIVLAATGDVPTQEIMAAADKLDAMGIKFKVVATVVDLVKLYPPRRTTRPSPMRSSLSCSPRTSRSCSLTTSMPATCVV